MGSQWGQWILKPNREILAPRDSLQALFRVPLLPERSQLESSKYRLFILLQVTHSHLYELWGAQYNPHTNFFNSFQSS